MTVAGLEERLGERERLIGAREAARLGTVFGALVLVAALGADRGGYWPTAWGWTALAVLWPAGIAVVLRPPRLRPLDIAFVGLLLAFCGWMLLSSLWSSATAPFLEGERALVYVGLATLAIVVVSARTHRSLLGGVTAAIVLVSTYSLATRLFPERLGRFDAIAGYRLSVPVGYWNALGIFAAMGVLLAFGFAVRGLQPIARAVAGASTVPLTATLYFTYSRGAWVALAFGALAMLALDTRRLQLLGAFLLIAPPAAVGVWLASRFEALTNRGSTLAAASPDGHRLALLLAFLSICAIAATVVLSSLAKRLKPQRTARMVLGIAIIGAVVGLLLGIFARYGSPSTLARRAYDSFSAPAPAIPTNLNKRLFVLSGGQRVPQWKVAWHDFKAHPWLGSGAGSYHAYWLQRRPIAAPVLDAHSLYLETLAEMGPVGLALVVGALLMPIIAAVRTRHRSLVAPAFGTYCAYMLHAGVDWDWEMLAVTAVAVLVGAALLGVARPDDARPMSITARGALVIACAGASAFAFVGLLSNTALANSRNATAAERWRAAASDARKAIRWAPWSSAGWQQLGEVQLQQGQLEDARSSFRKGLAKSPDNWELWLDLAFASSGQARHQAALQALRLDPLAPEIAQVRAGLGLGAGG